MGFIYRQTYTTVDKQTGQRVTRRVKAWYIEYRDADGSRVREKGFADKASTRALLAKREQEVTQRKLGVIPSSGRRALADYLADYLTDLESRDCTASHIATHRRAIVAVLDATRWNTLADVRLPEAEAYYASMRKRLSPKSVHAYATAVKSFLAWVARREGMPSPLENLRAGQVNRPVRVRRVLSQEDFAAFVSSTNRSLQIVAGLTGKNRAMLYLTAAYTGLRASELAALTPAHLSLATSPPTVRLPGVSTKNRQAATLPLPADLAAKLHRYVRRMRPTDPLWPGNWCRSFRGARMVRVDLAAAGIPYRDEQGRQFDFHALRAQFITSLARSGVPLAQAQKLARHSTPAMTSNYYTLLETQDLGEQVEKLPPVPDLG